MLSQAFLKELRIRQILFNMIIFHNYDQIDITGPQRSARFDAPVNRMVRNLRIFRDANTKL